MKIVSHGITFIRKGKCKRCGACEKSTCPHYIMVNGKATCQTYGRGDYLEWKCNVFPDNPFCRVVREGICGFKFTPATNDDILKYREYLRTWRLAD